LQENQSSLYRVSLGHSLNCVNPLENKEPNIGARSDNRSYKGQTPQSAMIPDPYSLAPLPSIR
jgi:hypothetical protein